MSDHQEASSWSCFLHGEYEPSECPHCISVLRHENAEMARELHQWRLGDDSYAELIEANQQAIAEVNAKALSLIREEFRRDGLRTAHIQAILDAAQSFHPMHGESWSGFPSDDVPVSRDTGSCGHVDTPGGEL